MATGITVNKTLVIILIVFFIITSKILVYIIYSQDFFKKLARVWGEQPHKNGAFFLPSFFFAPLVPKKKRDCGIQFMLKWGRKLFKRSFSSHTPPSFKNFEAGGLFFSVISALNARTHNVCTVPSRESFQSSFFQKTCGVWGRAP